MAIREKLAAENPAVTEFRSRLAASHNNLGNLLAADGPADGVGVGVPRGGGDPGEAGRGEPRRHRLPQPTGGQPQQPRHPADRDGPCEGGGVGVPRGAGDPGEAGRGEPRRHRIPQATGNSQNNLGNLLRATGKRRGGGGGRASHDAGDLAEAGRGQPRRRRLPRALVLCPQQPRRLCSAPSAGWPRPATATTGQSLSRNGWSGRTRRPPRTAGPWPSSLRRRGLARRDLGDAAGAAADARQALGLYDGLPSRSGWEWYETACCHAALAGLAGRGGPGLSAAEAPVEAEAAMGLLHKAVAMGYRDIASFRTEAALDPLRDRADFRLLMMDLVFPAEAFARDE